MHTETVSFRRIAADIAASCTLLVASILLISHRTEAQSGALTGIQTCLCVLVPSLFPFVILSCVLTTTRISPLLFRPISPVMRYLFRLPACAAPALLFGLTLGYPIGIKITSSLYADGRLTRAETARLLCFCTAPGYAFSLCAGTQLTGRTDSGILLFISCAAAPFLFGLLLSLFTPLPSRQFTPSPITHTFPEAVREGTSAMITMCSFLVLFSSVTAVLQAAGVFRAAAALLSRTGLTVPTANVILRFLLEVTSGLSHCAYWNLSPVLAAFGLGFGGLCIHLQFFSFFKKQTFPLPVPLYLLARLINGILCAGVYSILSRLFPSAVETAGTGTPIPALSNNDPALSAVLLALSLFFLLVCGSKNTAHEKQHRIQTF